MPPIPTPISLKQSLGQMGQNALVSIANANPLSMVGNAAGGIIGGIAGAIQARKMRKFQREMLKRQQDFALDMWNKNNEYNTPLAKRNRLEDGGYNPFYTGSDGIVGQSVPTSVGSVPSSPNMGFASTSASSFGRLGSDLESGLRSQTDYIKALSEVSKIENDKIRDNAYVDLERNRLDMEFSESVARIGQMAQDVLTSKSQQLFNDQKTAEVAINIIRNWLDSSIYRTYLDSQSAYNRAGVENLKSLTTLNKFDAWLKSPDALLGQKAYNFLKSPANKKALFELAKFGLEEPKLRFELDKVNSKSQRVLNERLGFGAVAGGLVGGFSLFKGRGSSSSVSDKPSRPTSVDNRPYRLERNPRDPNKKGAQKKYKRVYD